MWTSAGVRLSLRYGEPIYSQVSNQSCTLKGNSLDWRYDLSVNLGDGDQVMINIPGGKMYRTKNTHVRLYEVRGYPAMKILLNYCNKQQKIWKSSNIPSYGHESG